MTERPPDEHISPETRGVHRPASVSLREEAAEGGAPLDPANQSLADALRLIFRGLQVAMVVLLGVFAFSGLQTVKETESGIKLLFGRRTADKLKPGPQFAAPYPFGELIKIDTGVQRLELNESFWPRLSPEQQKLSVEKVAQMGKPTLKPGEDGSSITADQNIAHTRWAVQYRRVEPGKNVSNVYKDDETEMVRASVERGVVHALATTSIDDLLKQSSGDQASVARRAQAMAQATLDEIQSGIQIEQLTLQDKAPPFHVYNSFSGVQSAEQKASQQRESALGMARNILNSTAGAAHEPLIAQIDRYEAAIAKGDQNEQARTLDTIYALLDGRPVAIGDREIKGAVAGQVTAILNSARQYRSTIVSQRRAELSAYQSKLAQFKTNPDLVVQRDWADAMTRLFARDMVEVFWVPPGMDRVELWLNRDVLSQREWEKARKLRDLKKKEEEQRIASEKESTRTRTDQIEVPLDVPPGR